MLLREPAVGLDTEWRPVMVKGQASGVSLLQLAGPEEVFLFDLLEELAPDVEAAIPKRSSPIQ